MVELKNITLLAQGGQAEIYDYGDNKVLRVLRNPQEENLLKNEIEIMNALKCRNVCVPQVYEYLAVDGRPAVVVEKILGDSMLTYLQKHPLRIWTEARILADLHLQLANTEISQSLQQIKERARFLTGKSEFLSSKLKDFVYNLISDLPEGNDLCHGDFHPGNILKSAGRNYIIDWFGAYRGALLSDVAHSYLIMKNVPRFPGVSKVQHVLMGLTGSLLASEYVGAFYRLKRFNWGEFSKWLVVKAAERTYFGWPAEKQRLIEIIGSCYNLYNRGVNSDVWCKKLPGSNYRT